MTGWLSFCGTACHPERSEGSFIHRPHLTVSLRSSIPQDPSASPQDDRASEQRQDDVAGGRLRRVLLSGSDILISNLFSRRTPSKSSLTARSCRNYSKPRASGSSTPPAFQKNRSISGSDASYTASSSQPRDRQRSRLSPKHKKSRTRITYPA